MRIRRLDDTDSLEALTALLNRAYAPLQEAGLRFVAARQGVDVTRDRIRGGECWVAEIEGVIVGTILLFPPRPTAPGEDRGAAWYARPDVAKFGQFGVDPAWKGQGVGRALMDHVERRARELGAVEIACDTAAPAAELRATYARRGYREVENCDWRPHTNYVSVLLSLTL
jgi:GNAT superfamily N-acetyltransferase